MPPKSDRVELHNMNSSQLSYYIQKKKQEQESFKIEVQHSISKILDNDKSDQTFGEQMKDIIKLVKKNDQLLDKETLQQDDNLSFGTNNQSQKMISQVFKKENDEQSSIDMYLEMNDKKDESMEQCKFEQYLGQQIFSKIQDKKQSDQNNQIIEKHRQLKQITGMDCEVLIDQILFEVSNMTPSNIKIIKSQFKNLQTYQKITKAALNIQEFQYLLEKQPTSVLQDQTNIPVMSIIEQSQIQRQNKMKTPSKKLNIIKSNKINYGSISIDRDQVVEKTPIKDNFTPIKKTRLGFDAVSIDNQENITQFNKYSAQIVKKLEQKPDRESMFQISLNTANHKKTEQLEQHGYLSYDQSQLVEN